PVAQKAEEPKKEAARLGERADGFQTTQKGWGLILRRAFRRRTVAPLGHEGIELGLVLGEAKPLQERLELALLFFQSPQGVVAVFIEGRVAARRGPEGRTAAETGTAAHLRAHPVHLRLQAIHLVLPAIVAAITASHSSTP